MVRFSALALATAFACAVYGQGKGGGGPVTVVGDVQQNYNQVKNLLVAAAEAMPEDGYSLVPGMGERNFGGWVAHVADSQAGACGRLTGNAQNLGAGNMTSKADLVAALRKSFDMCDAAYQGTTDANANDQVQSFRGSTPRLAALYGNVIHDNECYGSMAVYLRIKGIVPPSSAGRGGGAGKGGKGKQ